jgi:hypothetical protein
MDANVIEQGFREVWEMFRETDRKIQESDRKFHEELEARDRKFHEELDVRDRKFHEDLEALQHNLAASQQRFEESVNQSIKNMEDVFIGKWGRFMEVLVKSGALTAFRQYGVPVKRSAGGVNEQLKNGQGRGMEIDVLCWNDDVVIAIEVKTTLKVEHVRDQEERLQRFFECFPDFREKRLYGAVAGLTIEEEADKYAYRQGLYVLTLIGDNLVKVLNDQKFCPRDWGTSGN